MASICQCQAHSWAITRERTPGLPTRQVQAPAAFDRCLLQPRQRRVKASAAKQATCSVTPADPLHPLSGTELQPQQCWRPTGLFIAAAAVLAAFLLKAKEKKAAVREEPCRDDSALGLPLHSADALRQHQRTLAKARQATHIANAIAYNRTGEFTAAMLELQKALADNSICRAPAVLSYSKEDMADLYRLHIRSCEHPPLFATLLQLQEMLGLSQEEAEKIELELMTIPGAFAI